MDFETETGLSIRRPESLELNDQHQLINQNNCSLVKSHVRTESDILETEQTEQTSLIDSSFMKHSTQSTSLDNDRGAL